MLRGANLPTLGDFNQSLVLDVIRRHPEGIGRRLRELDREWDVERALEANASASPSPG